MLQSWSVITVAFCGQKESKIVGIFCMQLSIITSRAMTMLLSRYLTYKELVSFNHQYGQKEFLDRKSTFEPRRFSFKFAAVLTAWFVSTVSFNPFFSLAIKTSKYLLSSSISFTLMISLGNSLHVLSTLSDILHWSSN